MHSDLYGSRCGVQTLQPNMVGARVLPTSWNQLWRKSLGEKTWWIPLGVSDPRVGVREAGGVEGRSLVSASTNACTWNLGRAERTDLLDLGPTS